MSTIFGGKVGRKERKKNVFKVRFGNLKWRCILVSAGIELIFFLIIGVVLCFGFGMKIMPITY